MGRTLKLALTMVGVLWGQAAWADCSKPASEAITQIDVSGHPFSAVPTPDGCTIFVSLTDRQSRIAVLKRDNGAVSVGQMLPIDGLVTGMALSPDGRFLAAANGSGVLVFDAAALAGGNAKPLAAMSDGTQAGSIYAAFTPDSHLLFVANERSASLSLYDVTALPAPPRLIGQIGVGNAPVGLVFSPDGKILYSTSEAGPRTWPSKCQSEGPPHPEGMLLVLDVTRAVANPKDALVSGVAAGCNAVRVALSPDGHTAYVTARGDNAVNAFDTSTLLTDATHARSNTVTVGVSPVGVAVAEGHVFVTNSNRFGGGTNQSVSVLDAADLTGAQHSIPAGGFPRELKLTKDGKTLLVTNYQSGTVELVDLARLPQAAK